MKQTLTEVERGRDNSSQRQAFNTFPEQSIKCAYLKTGQEVKDTSRTVCHLDLTDLQTPHPQLRNAVMSRTVSGTFTKQTVGSATVSHNKYQRIEGTLRSSHQMLRLEVSLTVRYLGNPQVFGKLSTHF